MRTTIDLPDDLHQLATSIARDAGTPLSETVTALLRQAVRAPGPVTVSTSARTGLRVVTLGAVVTSEHVRSLADEE